MESEKESGERRSRAVKLSDLLADDAPEDAPLPRRRPVGRARSDREFEESEESGGIREAGEAAAPEESAKSRIPRRPAAYAAALRILAAGDNSVRMLREKLARKGYAPDEIAGVLDALIGERTLDDARLMERYAAALAEKRFYGLCRVRMEMLRRFDREAVDAHFAEAVSGIDFAAYAAKFAQKYAATDRQSLVRRMQARGYAASEIRRALGTLSGDGT